MGAALRADMCADICTDMHIDAHMCTDMCTGMCTEICTGMCTDICKGMHIDIELLVLGVFLLGVAAALRPLVVAGPLLHFVANPSLLRHPNP